MEQKGLTGALFDFLYQDPTRVPSYYAQFFSGLLSSVEEGDQRKQATERVGKMGVPSVISGEAKHVDETTNTVKRVIDPHDQTVIDVLTELSKIRNLSKDPTIAPHNSFVHVRGTIVFIDKAIFGMTAGMLGSLGGIPDPEAAKTLSQIVGMLASSSFISSCFCLQLENGSKVAGIIKDDGMTEPISSYYLRHGANGIHDVHLIGIKEAAATSVTLPDSGFIAAIRQFAELMSGAILPAAAVRVTPLAIYREL